jgi:hypothetical protein
MAKRDNRNDWGVMELTRERPIAAAAVAAGAAAAGLFLWSKRTQISEQLSGLSDQIGQWTEGMRSGGDFTTDADTTGLTTSATIGSPSTGRTRRRRGTSTTGGRRQVQAETTTPE